jgi:hypothetical protein
LEDVGALQARSCQLRTNVSMISINGRGPASFGTLDCGRGCPFACSFCTIINVQGRKMRFRSAEHIARGIRRNYHAHGITFYFFTDDNFARNKNWEAIFDALIRLREEKHIPLKFMMQVDVLSWRARAHSPALRVPSKLHLLWARWVPLLAPRSVCTRADLDSFWQAVRKSWSERRWFRIPPHGVALNLFREAQLSLLFLLHFGRTREPRVK